MDTNCKKLIPLTTPPKTFAFPEASPVGITHLVKKGKYFGYNTESVTDFGWGCAWRCVQMVLYHQLESLTPSFADLFNNFGSKEVLINLYKALHNLESIPPFLEERKFAPHELESGWAEPFIGQLVLFHYDKKPRDLFLLNAYPPYANAPVDVFPKEVCTFATFVEKLKAHFCQPDASPVMIDDAHVALCIIGIGFEENLINFWIADPHILEEADAKAGLYIVTTDKEGRCIKSSLTEEQRKMLCGNGYDTLINFFNKPWMVLM